MSNKVITINPEHSYDNPPKRPRGFREEIARQTVDSIAEAVKLVQGMTMEELVGMLNGPEARNTPVLLMAVGSSYYASILKNDFGRLDKIYDRLIGRPASQLLEAPKPPPPEIKNKKVKDFFKEVNLINRGENE